MSQYGKFSVRSFRPTVGAIRAKSTPAAGSASASRKYIDTWLGNDLNGERYLTRLVNGSKIEHISGSSPQPQQQPQQQLSSSSKSPARLIEHPIAAATRASLQSFYLPSLVIDWTALVASSADESSEYDLPVQIRGSPLIRQLSLLRPPGMTGAISCVLDMFDAPVAALRSELLRRVVQAARECGLQCVAAVNLPPGAETLQEALQDAGLALLPHTPWQAQGGAPGLTREAGAVTKRSPKGRDSQNEATGQSQLQLQKMKGCAGNAYSLSSAGSMIHYGPVRSGQQLYAEGRSLVVVGSVNDGAELLADGDIHVYGRLAGRAMAGLAGGRGARIFAQDFNPSLFGVADAFVMTDDADAVQGVLGRSVCVRLHGTESGEQAIESPDAPTLVECGEGRKLVINVLS